VDQFEEVFTLCHDPAERAAFIALLTTAAAAPTSRLRIVIGVRTDFLGHCGQHPELVEALRASQVLVGRMTTEELRRAITEPAAAAGCKVETALVTRLVADAAGQPAVLPLLSHALLETWRRRRGVALTLAAYESAGGVEHAIARTAERVHLDLDPARQEVARRLFLRLIAVGEGTEDTKRRLGRRELADLDTADLDTADVVDRLAEARLVALDEDGVELAHEALIRNWPRLRAWIDADRDGLRTQRRLTEDADTWESLDRDPGALYRGTRLALARDGDRAAFTPREVEFLDAGVAAEEAVHDLARRRTRRLRRLVALMAVLLVVAATAVGYAFQAQRTATEQRNIALARKAISEATALRDTNPALSVQLSLAAYRLAPAADTRSGLLGAFAQPYADRFDGIRFAAASATRDLLVGVDRGVPTLWDVTDPHHPVRKSALDGAGVENMAAEFSPDGNLLVTNTDDRTIRLWDVKDPGVPVQVGELAREHGWVQSMAFDASGTLLAVEGMGGASGPAVWDVTDPAAPKRKAGYPTPLDPRGAVFGAGGTLVGVAVRPARAVVWNLATPDAPVEVPLDAPGSQAAAVAVSPDGRTAAIADGRAVGVWDLADARNPRRLTTIDKHADTVTALEFSPDGRTLASASADRVTHLWNVDDPAQPLETGRLTGHLTDISLLAFGGGGRTLVTAAGDLGARFTHLDDLPATTRQRTVSVAVNAARRIAAVIDEDEELRLVDLVGPERFGPGRPQAVQAFLAAFSPDGRFLVTATRQEVESVLRVWRVDDLAAPELVHVVGVLASVLSIEFSPRGDLVATGQADGRIRLWSTSALFGAGDLAVPDALPGFAFRSPLSFDSGGDVLTALGWPSTVVRWDLAHPGGPELPFVNGATAVVTLPAPGYLVVADEGDGVVLRSPSGDVLLVEGRAKALSQQGDVLVVTGTDGTVHLWDLSDVRQPRELARLTGHDGAVASTGPGVDAHSLVTVGEDGAIRFWDTEPDRVAERVCATAFPRMTAREWNQYFPGVDEDLPCR
ncbi:MAG: WD40 repeat domain-containing protein, partial [Umezawaea sp.]